MQAERSSPTAEPNPPISPLLRRVELLPLCPSYVPRPRLHELLRRNRDRRLVQIVAPAGFGKTTFLRAWARETAVPVAWLSPGAADSRLRVFIHALVTALQAVVPTVGDGLLSLLLMELPPSTDFIALAIAREMAELPHDLVLVIDGYEAIDDPAVHTLVGTLLNHIPTNVQVVMAARMVPHLPVARLRASGQLAEIGPSDLRFRPDEAEALFSLVADGDLPAPAVRALNDRLEGWPGLLGLVALRLAQPVASDARMRAPGEQADPSSWDDVLRQISERDIEGFLIEEVLESQPRDVQGLLVRLSIVDTFCADLCATLWHTEAPVTGAAALLFGLERQHLLIDSDGDQRTWYRWPPVLRDALRHHLQHAVTPLELMMIRRRACEWLAARGMVDEAIEQALACDDTVRVAELVEGSVASLLDRSDYPALEVRLGKVAPHLVASRPRLILARAWLFNFLSRFEAIPTVLASLDGVLELNEHGLAQADTEQLRAEAAAIRAVVATVAGDGAQVLTLARRAYDALPRFSGFPSAMATGYVGIGQHLCGETDAAIAFLERACQEDPEPDGVGRMVAHWALAFVNTSAARPKAVVRWADQLRLQGTRLPEHVEAWGELVQGLAYYELNRLPEAREHLRAAHHHGLPAHRLTIRSALHGMAMVEQASGDLAAASNALQAFRDVPGIGENPRFVAVIRLFEARLAYAGGDLEAVRHCLSEFGTEPLPIALESISGSPSLIRARLLIALAGEDDLAEAARVLDALEALAASVNDQLQLIGVQAARALWCQAHGDTDGALRFLEQAVAAAAPGGLVRTFVDLGPPMQWLIAELDRRSGWSRPYVTHLLAAFPATTEPSQPPVTARSGSHAGLNGTEALTWRETEVLRLLDARLSNQEISGVLFISADTVKKHTINIYRKLQVTGRREAVARAYALAILPAATTGPGSPAG
jgi:LuxR family maltose regulon positive regulatory protein